LAGMLSKAVNKAIPVLASKAKSKKKKMSLL
jgi:hypothetical protein